MTDQCDATDEKVKALIECGSDIAGGLAGSAVGFLLAGAAGAFVGGAGGPLIKQTLKGLAGEFVSRSLGRRERDRVGAAVIYAADKIRARLAQGDTVREDGFFDKPPGGRSAADEVAEGVILASQREYEEKKLRFYGNLIANLAFTSTIDKAHANMLVRFAQRLSHRQLCLLGLFGLRALSRGTLRLRESSFRRTPHELTDSKIPIFTEIYDLYMQALVNCGDDALLCPADIVPAKMGLQGAGVTLFDLMELRTVDPNDVNGLIPLLA